MLYSPLAEADPEVARLIKRETWRQFSGLELIASENLTSASVMEASGSILTNKYSEGLPGARYYGGNEVIDEVENLCRQRALEAFDLDPAQWGVNVQPYSGSPANLGAFTALLNPQDRFMGLGLSHGGHLTHGHYTAKKNISASSIYFQSYPYAVNGETGLVDYDALAETAATFKPKMIVCGGSAYPAEWEYERLADIAQNAAGGAYLLADIAHISGLVAAGVQRSPFDTCDVVTTTTHKTLRGPRAGLIFFRKDRYEGSLEDRVNAAVFPGLQGGPHNHAIGAIAVALKQVASPEFKRYAEQTVANAQALGAQLGGKYGHKLQTGGTTNHLLLWDLRPLGLTGSKVEKLADLAHITLNKNAVSGDTSAVAPRGVRIGTPALTSRNMVEKDMHQVGDYLHELVTIAQALQDEAGSKLLKAFWKQASQGDSPARQRLLQLAQEVQNFATQFPLPGVKPEDIVKP